MDEEQPKPAPPPSEQVIEAKKKIGEAFSVFDREGKNVCDVREVGTIIRSLNVYPTEKQLQRWIHEIEEEEPTGFIVYEKVNIVSCTMRCASAYRM
jgi:Ca2+-binding EF-hand superfamily protein